MYILCTSCPDYIRYGYVLYLHARLNVASHRLSNEYAVVREPRPFYFLFLLCLRFSSWYASNIGTYRGEKQKRFNFVERIGLKSDVMMMMMIQKCISCIGAIIVSISWYTCNIRRRTTTTTTTTTTFRNGNSIYRVLVCILNVPTDAQRCDGPFIFINYNALEWSTYR